MTATFLHTGDEHLDATKHGRLNPMTGLNTLWESNFTVLRYLVEQAISSGATTFISAGDSLDTGRPQQEAVLLLVEALTPLADAGISIVIIDGNHTRNGVPIDHRTVIHVVAQMLRAKGATVFIASKPELIVTPDGLQVAALPWLSKNQVLAQLGKSDLSPADGDRAVSDYGIVMLEQFAAQADLTQPLIMTGHVTVDHMRIDAVADGHRRGSEMDLAHLFAEPVLPIAALNDLPFQYGALGHIHTPQHFGDRYYYAGSPNRLTFTDMNDDKGGNLVTLNGMTPTVKRLLTPARKMTRIDFADDQFDTAIAALEPDTLVQAVLAPGDTVMPAEFRKRIQQTGAHLQETKTRTKPRTDSEQVILPRQVDPVTALRTWAEKNTPDTNIDTLVAAAEKLEN
ncbi:metallophosphoesterase [Curtobacterium sp. MCBD17_040]|uniref:metallophosphoesterase family protein n=1 Tax=Curtobacterium sp. MCBD17_040 TaxID=2175674 RepID=UPI000DA7F0F8|nr:metallophosphoesterase [Curtobacterium sp. MCBD17_040]WIB65679.1 metallophosphoesterase [Curtobacterium sp. MCBD17_040]